MKIELVREDTFQQAVAVYSASWRESHRDICTPEFLRDRDYAGYLSGKLGGLYLVSDDGPVGVFFMQDGQLGDLYIHPCHEGKGYGTACIQYAQDTSKQLRLTVLSSNYRAIRLYEKLGFRFTGADTLLRERLLEREMLYTEKCNG